MPFLQLPAGRIHYQQQGHGPDLLLIHNGFDSARTWEPLLTGLCDRYRVTWYDRIGFGRSAAAGTPDGDIVADGSEELLRILEALQIAAPALIGHCLGAAICLDFASTYPERVRGVVAEACGFFGDRDTVRRSALVFQPWEYLPEEARERFVFMHGPKRAPGLWAASCAYTTGYVMHEGYTLLPRLPRITCPVLVLAGEEDFLFPPAHTRRGAEAIPGAQMHLLPGAGHDLHRDHQEEWLTRTRSFLDTLPPLP